MGTLQVADVFVLPTFYPFEGQPLVLLEALAAGVPVVSTFHAGIPETVRNEKEGLLVPANDPPALAGAIRQATRGGVMSYAGKVSRTPAGAMRSATHWGAWKVT